MTIQQLNTLSDREFVAELWGDYVLTVIDRQDTMPMHMDDFLIHCTPCGGNWGRMLLSGINALYPEVYEAIPDDMGLFAWGCICRVITLLGIQTEEQP